MTETLFVVRLVHILTSIGWFGEVLTVNLVLLPALARADPELRARILSAVFPFVFRLATVLAGAAVVSGAILFLLTSGGNLGLLFSSGWGHRILTGGLIGAAVFVFHLVQESRWEGSLATRLGVSDHDPVASAIILRRLRIIPRVGLLVLLVAIILMSAAARLP